MHWKFAKDQRPIAKDYKKSLWSLGKGLWLELRNRLDYNINKKIYGDFNSFEKNQFIENLPKTKDQWLKTL
jgi:hypothetical protein